MRRLLILGLVVASVPWAPPAATGQAAPFPVVVFEGTGLGHGVGMPLDGANHMAASDEAPDADTILDRFYPGTGRGRGRGRGEGTVRLLLAARDDLLRGVDVVLPDGGVIRDGRTAPVAPSFPVAVPADGRVRLSFSDGFYRAEVLDGRSVSGTVEVTPTGASASRGVDNTAGDSDGPPPTLAASERSLWVEPRGRGALVVPGDPERRVLALAELVMEAEALHLVAELDVESYLSGLDLGLPDGTPLEPPAMEAAVIATRSYALRAARAEPRVGNFHLYADERSAPFAGAGDAPAPVRRAVRATKGRIVTGDDGPAGALVTVGAGGTTADPAEVFGDAAALLGYLRSSRYEGGQEFEWRVDMRLAEVARRLGYSGEAEGLSIVDTGTSGRPIALRIDGPASVLDVAASDFHAALRLPSTRFTLRVETRTTPLPDRQDSPPFQELPGDPLAPGTAGAASGDEGGAGGAGGVPLFVVLGAGVSLAGAFVILLAADVQRRVRRARERRRARARHPAVDIDLDVTAPEPEVAPEEAPAAVAPGPVWHNEPDWLADLVPPEEVVNEAAPERDARPLRERLGWDDAPDWLDEEPGEPDKPAV